MKEESDSSVKTPGSSSILASPVFPRGVEKEEEDQQESKKIAQQGEKDGLSIDASVSTAPAFPEIIDSSFFVSDHLQRPRGDPSHNPLHERTCHIGGGEQGRGQEDEECFLSGNRQRHFPSTPPNLSSLSTCTETEGVSLRERRGDREERAKEDTSSNREQGRYRSPAEEEDFSSPPSKKKTQWEPTPIFMASSSSCTPGSTAVNPSGVCTPQSLGTTPSHPSRHYPYSLHKHPNKTLSNPSHHFNFLSRMTFSSAVDHNNFTDFREGEDPSGEERKESSSMPNTSCGKRGTYAAQARGGDSTFLSGGDSVKEEDMKNLSFRKPHEDLVNSFSSSVFLLSAAEGFSRCPSPLYQNLFSSLLGRDQESTTQTNRPSVAKAPSPLEKPQKEKKEDEGKRETTPKSDEERKHDERDAVEKKKEERDAPESSGKEKEEKEMPPVEGPQLEGNGDRLERSMRGDKEKEKQSSDSEENPVQKKDEKTPNAMAVSCSSSSTSETLPNTEGEHLSSSSHSCSSPSCVSWSLFSSSSLSSSIQVIPPFFNTDQSSSPNPSLPLSSSSCPSSSVLPWRLHVSTTLFMLALGGEGVLQITQGEQEKDFPFQTHAALFIPPLTPYRIFCISSSPLVLLVCTAPPSSSPPSIL
ncbi:hypothetical protein CSUI_002792 [Cystoisospora suis]|uniref:Uncharacterized protein n=1 Tax=Cystoisospora suis TaxID=483139 RepID=A0A2C6L3C9_9APIC|nr:hypothetical protein CSUI_002792 [Cystoisospora suis]